MKTFWHWLITAAFLSAPFSSGLAADSLEGIELATRGESVGSSVIPGQATGGQLGLMDVVLASHVVLPQQRIQIGIGLGNDALVNGSKGWYGVYIQGLDRVPERNTIYGLLRETPGPRLADGTAQPAFCCTRSDTLTPPGQFASTIAVRQVSPTLYIFGMLRKKRFNIELDDGWNLQAGIRPMQYSDEFKTRVGYVTAEHRWNNFIASYSYELERASGVAVAPSHVLQVNYLYSAHNSIGISLTNGHEVAYFGPLSIVNTEVHSLAISGQHWLRQDLALTFQAGFNNHGSLPAQSGIRMGLSHSF